MLTYGKRKLKLSANSLANHIRYLHRSYVLGFIITTIGSCYGKTRQLVSVINYKWLYSGYIRLRSKRILILGTGPSLNKLTASYLSKFDHVVFLNHAVRKAALCRSWGVNKEDMSFYCADRHRILEVEDSLRSADLNRKNSIFFPDFAYSVFFFDLKRIPATLIGGWKNWILYYYGSSHERGGWHFTYNEHPMIDCKVKLSYDQFMQSKYAQNPPYIPYTVAFAAILYFSFYRPAKIQLLGCDFTDALLDFPTNEIFTKLQLWLSEYDIMLTNDTNENKSNLGMN